MGKKKGKKTKAKKVRFSRPKRTLRREQAEDTGGAIRVPKSRPVKIDKRKAAFTKALYDDYTPGDDGSFADVESQMYSHYGGQISGKGAAYDPPHVQRFLTSTFKKFPKLLAAYHAGRVVNPPMPRPKYG